jgi:hypothetical protein
MAERQHSIPDYLLERLVAGDLPEPAAAELRTRLERRGELDRIERLLASNHSILAAYPTDAVAAEVQRRNLATRATPEPRPARRSAFGLPILALSGAAALAVALLSPTSEQLMDRAEERSPASGAAEQITSKGLAPQLAVYKRTASGPERLRREDRVRAGDTLQLAYVAAGSKYGIIASLDGEGSVTLHLPEKPGSAARLAEGGETALPHAFELDDATGFEHFVFITSDVPFPSSAVIEGLTGKGSGWPEGLHVTDLFLEKAAP